jgi:dihydroflavonol-4-reductase
MNDTVLVTGGTGFVGAWCVVDLLNRGYRVRTTVRDLAAEQRVRSVIGSVVAPETVRGRLEVVAADLSKDDGWAAATSGVDAVLHVASPMVATREEKAVIRPAVDGVVRVLRAARDAGVRRVVYTSSCGAVYYGHPPQPEPFDEASWTNATSREMSAYVRSKALAERAAWDFVTSEGGDLELATVNPTGIFGPGLDPGHLSSLSLVKRLLDGRPPACPDLWFGVVDVRDVADLHVRAMTDPVAAGERFIASGGPPVSMHDIARVLKDGLGADARRVPTRRLPDWVVRVAGRFDDEVHDLVPLLGQRRSATSAKAQRLLGWSARAWEETVTASAESLLRPAGSTAAAR